MTLNPITVVDQVLEEYRAYLSTEFRASDARLRQALEAALNEPGFLAQEPFFQAHRPFKAGAAWHDLPIDAALAGVMAQRSGYSLGYALRTGMRGLYMLDGTEIEFHLEPMWEEKTDQGRRLRGALTFIDAAVGGSGFLDHAAAEFHLVAARTIEHLDHPNCESACYRCLKSYQNQRHHEHLSWPHVMPDLEALAGTAPTPLRAELGDADDPKPWLDAYDAGVGSPLELRFLRLFEQHGLEIDKQVPVSPDSGGMPISQADFRVVGTAVLIYVDGAAFHKGARLRRDRIIRERLRSGNMGWRVVEVRAADLGRGEDLVRSIRERAHSEGLE